MVCNTNSNSATFDESTTRAMVAMDAERDVCTVIDLRTPRELLALADRLHTALQEGRSVVVDLATAPAPSAAGIQLLVAAARGTEVLVLRRPSRTFVDGCSALGLFAALMAIPMERPV